METIAVMDQFKVIRYLHRIGKCQFRTWHVAPANRRRATTDLES